VRHRTDSGDIRPLNFLRNLRGIKCECRRPA
jgi:hypothetical protein